MKFEKVRLVLLRLRLKESNFYEDVAFRDKIVEKEFKKSVTKWLLNLQIYKKIQVDKFKDLFSKLSEVVFPITIDYCLGSYSFHIKFVDDNEHMYYLSSSGIYKYETLEEYLIGRRDSTLEPLVDREFHYKICEDEIIKLIESDAMKLNEQGLNDDVVVEFYYNEEKQTTRAMLKSYEVHNKIKIEYPTISDEFDKKVLGYLFSISKMSDYYYDVFPILEWIVAQILKKEFSVSIVADVGEDNEEISSEIQVLDGIVQRYVITKIISENEVQKFSINLSKSLDKFLMEKV